MKKLIVTAVVVPIGLALLAWAADQLAERHGESYATKLMRLPHQRRLAHR